MATTSAGLPGTVTVVHAPTGLNLAVSAGQQIDGASYVWTRAGWQTDFLAAGTTSLSVDYYNGSDFLSDGAKTENYGLYAVQSIDCARSTFMRAGGGSPTVTSLATAIRMPTAYLVGARWFF